MPAQGIKAQNLTWEGGIGVLSVMGVGYILKSELKPS
jgi:hypothetical protein